jgi:putative methionine-R-sulfoxide reductase with GAF domain
VLGPFHGEVACVTLLKGRGVCQKAVRDKSVVCVEDVNKFPSHISCDSHSQSELVVPLFVAGKVVAVLDIDSSEKDHFNSDLEAFFTEIGEILTTCFEATPNYLDILRINSHYIVSSNERDE